MFGGFLRRRGCRLRRGSLRMQWGRKKTKSNASQPKASQPKARSMY
jgi:hypothetical protein